MSDDNDIVTYSFSFPEDEAGMQGRECPNCRRYFKVKFGTGIIDPNHTDMTCPYCESVYPVDDFMTEDQQKYEDSHIDRLSYDLIEALVKDVFNDTLKNQKSSKNSFITLKWEYKPSIPPLIHQYVEQELQTTLRCENCSLEYAVWGIFAVCPDCRRPNLHQIAEANLTKLDHQADLKNSLQSKFGDSNKEDIENIFNVLAIQWIEDTYKDLVTVFETFSKTLNGRMIAHAVNPNRKATGNLFQRLNDSQQWFLDQYNFDLFNTLNASEVNLLHTIFNKRHILIHNMGIIDDKYVKEEKLTSDKIGLKVEVSDSEIKQGINILRHLFLHAKTLI